MHITYYLQKFNTISIIILTYEATQQSILTHYTVTTQEFLKSNIKQYNPHTQNGLLEESYNTYIHG